MRGTRDGLDAEWTMIEIKLMSWTLVQIITTLTVMNGKRIIDSGIAFEEGFSSFRC